MQIGDCYAICKRFERDIQSVATGLNGSPEPERPGSFGNHKKLEGEDRSTLLSDSQAAQSDHLNQMESQQDCRAQQRLRTIIPTPLSLANQASPAISRAATLKQNRYPPTARHERQMLCHVPANITGPRQAFVQKDYGRSTAPVH